MFAVKQGLRAYVLGLLVSIVAFSTNASESEAYVSAGAAIFDVSSFSAANLFQTGDVSIYGTYLSSGGSINDWMELEFKIGKGLNKEEGDADIELELFYGLQLRVTPLGASHAIKPYLALGAVKSKFEACFSGECESLDESNLSFGVGATLKLGQNFGLTAEYLRVKDLGNDGANVITASVDYFFD